MSIAITNPLAGLPFQCMSNSENDEDVLLVQQAAAGCSGSFEKLVRRHESRLFRFLIQASGNETDAADLLQETFVAIYRNLNQFNSKKSFTTWMFVIARRKAIDQFRMYKKECATPLPEAIDERDPSRMVIQEESGIGIWAEARKYLTATQFQALWLKYVEELSISDMAQVLGISAVHARVTLFRAKAILSSRMDKSALQI